MLVLGFCLFLEESWYWCGYDIIIVQFLAILDDSISFYSHWFLNQTDPLVQSNCQYFSFWWELDLQDLFLSDWRRVAAITLKKDIPARIVYLFWDFHFVITVLYLGSFFLMELVIGPLKKISAVVMVAWSGVALCFCLQNCPFNWNSQNFFFFIFLKDYCKWMCFSNSIVWSIYFSMAWCMWSTIHGSFTLLFNHK